MQPQKTFLFDTSILSPITLIDPKLPPTTIYERWELFLDKMEIYHANFADKPFYWLRRPTLYLEMMGLGDIRMGLKSLVGADEWTKYSAMGAELGAIEFYKVVENRIRNFIYKKIPAKSLYRKMTVDFLRTYKYHQHAHWLFAKMKHWAKNIREPHHYNVFAEALIWDTLSRYPFINLKGIPKAKRLEAMKLWAGVAALITNKYIESRAAGLEYSGLGFFAEVHKNVDCFISPNPDEKKYDSLIRTWDDIADADTIHFALLGYNEQPANIVTMENTNELKRRVQCLYQNLNTLSTYGFKTDFFPGTIANFSQDLRSVDFFSVQDIL